MKNLVKLPKFILVMVIICFSIISCKEPSNNFPGNGNEISTGSISGKVNFTNSNNHSGITITLERTDGLRPASVVEANRSIASGAGNIDATRSVAGLTQTASDGSFTLHDIPVGMYVLYASSQNSLEKAVTANVTVTANQIFDAGTLNLTPVGSIEGTITVESGNPMGFLVCVAGTSFMAMSGTDGKFKITGVPAKTGYTILIMRGDFVVFYSGNALTTISVTGGDTTTLDTRNITNHELLNNIVSIGANGNWFINGVDTGISATGAQGEQGQAGNAPYIGTNGNWWIGATDTGVKAQGTQGEQGQVGNDGYTPYIGTNGNWWIGTTDTGVKAQGPQGEQGQAGNDGYTPYIGTNSNWWIGTTDTGIKAQGQQGEQGQAGNTPYIGTNGNWWIGTSDTGVKAQGPQGEQGQAGNTPYIGINGNWWIGTSDTGVKAQGPQGEQGQAGNTPYIGINGNWWIGMTDTGVKAQGEPSNNVYQTPVASDYTFGRLNQNTGNVIAVTITANSGKSPGAIFNIRYNGNTSIPQEAGIYIVTFDVVAATGWNHAAGLSAGNLVVSNQTPVASDYTFGNRNQITGNVTAVTITANSGKSPGTIVNIRYNGNPEIPQEIGTYSITFDVAAATGWNAVIGLSAGNLFVYNQTPVASDYTFGNREQNTGNVTAVTITANSGKSPGAIVNIRYNGNPEIPQEVGTYSITFDVTAATGWNAASGLWGGTLTIVNPLTGIVINLTNMNEWELIEQTAQATVNISKQFTVSGTYSTYRWFLDGVLVGTSANYIFNSSEKNTYQLVVIVTNNNGESRSGRCRITVSDPIILNENIWVNSILTSIFDEGWFSFPVIQGTTYRIWWNSANQGNGTKNGRVVVGALYLDSNSWIFGGTTYSVESGWSTPRSFTANESGTVYIRVIPANISSSSIGTYGIVFSTGTSRPEVQ
ncbi:MAG: hypothetical protein FWD40_11645 [Treponema sp.]|nr:hypothetical protein [Treponema sp.]